MFEKTVVVLNLKDSVEEATQTCACAQTIFSLDLHLMEYFDGQVESQTVCFCIFFKDWSDFYGKAHRCFLLLLHVVTIV